MIVKTVIKVTKNLKQWEKVKKRLLTSSQNQLDIGFFAESKYGSDNDNLNVAAVAAWNELGDSRWNVNIPPRPFMRNGLGNYIKSSQFKSKLSKEVKLIFSGKKTPNAIYDSLGKDLEYHLKKEILEWSNPPNAPSTIANKGFNDPLIETGLMYDSVKYKIRKTRKRYTR